MRQTTRVVLTIVATALLVVFLVLWYRTARTEPALAWAADLPPNTRVERGHLRVVEVSRNHDFPVLTDPGQVLGHYTTRSILAGGLVIPADVAPHLPPERHVFPNGAVLPRGAPEVPPLSEGQLEIMNIVWDRGKTTVGEIWRLLAERRSISRNTVSTMVTRLEEKGWLRHRVVGGAYLYRATHAREKVLPRLVRRLVDSAFAGSVEGLVLMLLEGGRLSAEEVERIKAMLDRAQTEMRETEP